MQIKIIIKSNNSPNSSWILFDDDGDEWLSDSITKKYLFEKLAGIDPLWDLHYTQQKHLKY